MMKYLQKIIFGIISAGDGRPGYSEGQSSGDAPVCPKKGKEDANAATIGQDAEYLCLLSLPPEIRCKRKQNKFVPSCFRFHKIGVLEIVPAVW